MLAATFFLTPNHPRPRVEATPGLHRTRVEGEVLESLQALLARDLGSVNGVDIGLMNLLCAQGLRGAERLDLAECLSKLDGIARHVGRETDRHYYRFREKPHEYGNSEGYFRMLFLAGVVQQDAGVRYNPQRITNPGVFEPNDVFFSNAADVFVHGLLDDRREGTCSSLPVFYVAVGRRLGYPLKLAAAKSHLFVRWENDRERFNIDATGVGFTVHDDDYYREWPLPFTAEEEARFGYLKSLSPRQELSVFLAIRGHCLMSMGRYQEAIQAHVEALRYFPESKGQELILAKAREDIALRTQPRVTFPADAILQVSGDAADWAVRRAEILSQQRRSSGVGPADPSPLIRSAAP